MRRLIDEGTHYFLSRPRRFGKSLFLDTLKELFEGNEPLFEGLDIHNRWDWQVRYPVLRLSFGSGNFNEPEILHKEVMAQLDAIEEETGVESHYDTASARFRHIIQMLHRQIGQPVVVLIDEYDKPILDALPRDCPRQPRLLARPIRHHQRLRRTRPIQFLTGVSKFSKVRLFSGLNNLTDITIDPRYSAICGYTEEDLDTVFAPELPGLDRNQIRTGTTAIAGWATKKCTTPSTSSSYFDDAASKPTGSRLAHPPSSSKPSSTAASVPSNSMRCSAATSCYPPLTLIT